MGSLEGRVEPFRIDAIGELTSSNRPMQGQSPHVLNFLLSYESLKLTSSLVFNVIGERVVGLGTKPDPDVYEQPFYQLDLISSYQLDNGVKLGLSIRNLLDDEARWEKGGAPIREFRKGRDISFTASYKFQ